MEKGNIPSPRRWARGLAKGLAALLTLCSLAAGGAALWLFGWRFRRISHWHASWSPQERAALALLDAYIRKAAPRTLFRQGWELCSSWKGRPPEWQETWDMLCDIRDNLHPLHAVLRQAAATGRGDLYTELGDSPARWAVWGRNMAALKAFVLHGCDPNHPYQDEKLKEEGCWETLVVTLLGGTMPTHGKALPAKERLEMLDWLAGHGGGIGHFPPGVLNRYCLISGVMGSDRGAAYGWCFRHGLTTGMVEDADSGLRHNIAACLASVGGSLPLLRRLTAEGRLQLHERRAYAMPLQTAVCSHPRDAGIVRWLLEQGCHPDSLPETPRPARSEGMDDGAYADYCNSLFINERPLERCLGGLLCPCGEESPEPAGYLQADMEILELLLRHGARLRQEQQEYLLSCKGPDSGVRPRVMRLLHRYNQCLDCQ